ncbi:MAG: DUF3108 domain-containing protein [Gammaproteobacteria bacterium]
MRAASAVALLLVSAGALAAEPKLPELDLKYAVAWRGMGLGSATITLKQQGGTDCYRYESLTDPVGLVRMFYGKPRETSDFCVQGGRVVPKRFEFEDPKGDDSFTLEFEPGKVRTKKQVREVPANVQDRFGIQQAVRLWVLEHLDSEPGAVTAEYAMVDERRIRTYRFAITGRESVEVPAGKFDAVLVQRVDDKKKTIRFWLAPGRDYMPVKVEQVRQGKTELRLELR